MNCLNCKQLGHTTTHCCNKARCGKCGENHKDDTCDKSAERCVYCEETPHELSTCPVYKEKGDKLKRSLREQHNCTFVEMLKRATIPPRTETLYALLPVDEQEQDEPIASTSSDPLTRFRKRKKPSPSVTPRVVPRVVPTPKPTNGEQIVLRAHSTM